MTDQRELNIKCSAWSVRWSDAFIYRGLLPVLFKTRKQARDFIEAEYGHRPDLKLPPFRWKVPTTVPVIITQNNQKVLKMDRQPNQTLAHSIALPPTTNF